MGIRNRLYKIADRALTAANLRPALDDLASFSFAIEKQDSLRKQAAPGSVASAFFEAEGRPVHKWHHYLEIYEHHLSQYRGTPLLFLEIGVFDGGSLDMWRRYFGQKATIVGIDINQKCSDRVDPPNIVRIGSQADPNFLNNVVAEFGRPDVVLDDGSHIASHQRASFGTLFEPLKDGGLYIIEDVHTSYWAEWEGGFRRGKTGIEFVKEMIDDIHEWYHKRPHVAVKGDTVGAIHIYDSVVVVEKRNRGRPGMIRGGGTRT
jgi:cephalosporin hydroxylase